MSLFDSRLANELLALENCHVPIELRSIPDASLLWVNARAAKQDPKFIALGCDLDKYGQHLLASCAFLVTSDACKRSCIGISDRYGGAGIGHNGGSGRAVMVNGYNVKGVGRTPLVSALTPDSHASGGAYLEECVREAIFSEVAALRMPHSAVPTLAIIDTGLVQDWKTTWIPTKERRTLLVRPAFLRPANFERATGFISPNRREGGLDAERVQRMFIALRRAVGKAEAEYAYRAFFVKWAEQLAYGFIHRLPHVANTTSNITLDGCLVDFGAMTATPSWARTATSLHHQGYKENLRAIEHAIDALGYFFGKHLAETLGTQEGRASMKNEVRRTYMLALAQNLLDLLGVGHLFHSQYMVSSANQGRISRIAVRLLQFFDSECLDMLEATPRPRLDFPIHHFWARNAPSCFRELRAELDRWLSTGEISSLRSAGEHYIDEHQLLFFAELKRRLYTKLDRSAESGLPPEPAEIAQTIDLHVAAGMKSASMFSVGISQVSPRIIEEGPTTCFS